MMPKMTVTRSSAEDPHAAAGEQQQQAADKAPRTTEQEPAPKVHEPKPPQQQPRRQPYRQAADKAAHGSNGEQEPAPKAEPRTPQPQRQQPPRQESMKEKGKAPMVQEPPAVAPHVAVEALARLPLPYVATQLTRREKEEDWFAMTGGRLPYRPLQRRPKAVEDKLQVRHAPPFFFCLSSMHAFVSVLLRVVRLTRSAMCWRRNCSRGRRCLR
uniref:Uncharacterized protein n=1 Tax=Aegilops tauschii subsp. strangulata TaxID=200361 RepID=A0A452ZUS1_AEGTS